VRSKTLNYIVKNLYWDEEKLTETTITHALTTHT